MEIESSLARTDEKRIGEKPSPWTLAKKER
jgi:hypothetical protein